MKKTKGITIPCPHCKKVLIRYAVIEGKGSFETLCPHCKELVVVCMGKEQWLTAKKAATVLIILLLVGIYQVYLAASVKHELAELVHEYEIIKE